MRFVAPILFSAMALAALSACNTVVTRREMYSPATARDGYWHKKERAYRREEGLWGISKPDGHQRPGRGQDDSGIFGVSRPRISAPEQ